MLEVNKVHNLDCLEGLKSLDDNSVDSIVTDPPYELGFMGKSWDSTGIAYKVEVWKECLRVLKPGGHLLSFGGTRTYHRLACAIEDAGFEIRDQIQWIYGSGFPKSHNISKAIDKKFGAEREKIPNPLASKQTGQSAGKGLSGSKEDVNFIEPNAVTDEAKQYDGWGTALKPANEPIVVARKPLSEKTIVDNVLKWGTGGINIDECRVETTDNLNGGRYADNKKGDDGCTYGSGINKRSKEDFTQPEGRFPANVILDEEAGLILDEQSGTLKSGTNAVRTKEGFFVEHGGLGKVGDVQITYGDSGGASRFFYCAKAAKKEKGKSNSHPTVKPIKLMEYLVRLVTSKGGIVLDPFAGSGTTLIAAKNEGMNYIGFELEEEYIEIINERLLHVVSV